ncbi:M16 family metallopeptidase [Dyadobacter tibetensis]|uniref:M16 family metallopeptidase n=1 Tax=Dyadobacter tibetensis TaxID=1211851 RepID=UPI00046F30CA|nr:pitrilysin family protein [Dyadobacter tibetensis]
MKHIFLSLFTLFSLVAHAQHHFKLPSYETVVLKNGLTIFLMEQHEVPVIHASFTFDAGSMHDGSNSGLANLTADALLLGTKKFSKTELDDQVDYVGATLRSTAGKESAGITATFAKKDQDLMLEILKEVSMFPTFDSIEFNKNKERTLLNLQQLRESPRSVIANYYNALLFPNFPYGAPREGTPLSVAPLSSEMAQTFYKQFYTTDRAALALVGDFDSALMKRKLTAIFGVWKTNAAALVKRKAPELDFKESRVLLINKEDARETTFLIGGKGIDYNSPDYVPVMVINTILGGRFTSWLNDALRVNSGLTYGARSGFSRYKYAGTFQISTFTKNETTVPAIDLALQVLDSLHQHGITTEILESAKAYVKGDFPPNYESSGSLAQLLTDMYRYGFDENYINTFQQKVENIDLKQAKEIIARYFPKDNLQFVLIGKADEIREQVKKYGNLLEKEIKDDHY